MIKNIVFDLNGVLYTHSPASLKKATGSSIRKKAKLFEVLASREWEEYNRGDYEDLDGFLTVYLSTRKGNREELREMLRIFNAESFPYDEELMSFMEDHPEYDYYLLSNTVPDQAESFPKARFYPLMKGIMVSFEERLLKPDPAFYTRFLEKYDLNAEECLFIDDNKKNTAIAEELGFHTITHKTGASTLRAIRKETETWKK